MSEEDKSRVEGLNDVLYSRTRYKNPIDKRSEVKELDTPDVEESWQSPSLDEMLTHERTIPQANPFIKKIFIFSLLFFIAAILVASFVFTGGANFVSSKNVDINVLGPITISAGAVLELGVSVANTNNADLEVANLSIQYPQGSRNPDNNAESLTYTKVDLGVIKAGAEAIQNARVVLLGSSGEVKEVKFSVEYKVKGSNATFYKDKIYELTIGEAPITLSVDSPHSITSGENFTTTVLVTLNAKNVLKDVILKAEYPYGYSALEAVPNSVADDNIWVLGDLSPGDKKKISIRGRLVGQNQEERTFRFYVGVSDSSSTNPNLKIALVSLLNTIAVDRPSLGLDITFNNENVSTYIAPIARPIVTVIKFQNNLPDKLFNPRLEIRFSGVALDKSSVIPQNKGFYDSRNNSIIWNLANPLGHPELAPGEDGQVSFNFASLPALSLPVDAREIVLDFFLSGVPTGAIEQAPSMVSEGRTIKISSQVNFSSKAFRSLGSFVNHGPVPPKVGEETTYTVVLSVGNTQGDLTEAKVNAKLGQGVTLLSSPVGTENIIYDSISNTLIWDLGQLPSGSGFSSAARELVFQISLKPSIGQIGIVPSLVNSIVFSGRDTTTGEFVTVNNPPLTTRLLSDPAFIQGDDLVQE